LQVNVQEGSGGQASHGIVDVVEVEVVDVEVVDVVEVDVVDVEVVEVVEVDVVDVVDVVEQSLKVVILPNSASTAYVPLTNSPGSQ
jgi:hypothetical protein